MIYDLRRNYTLSDSAPKISPNDLRRCAMMRLEGKSEDVIAQKFNLTVDEVHDLPFTMSNLWTEAYDHASTIFANDRMSEVFAVLCRQLHGPNAREASEAAKAIMRWTIHLDKKKMAKDATELAEAEIHRKAHKQVMDQISPLRSKYEQQDDDDEDDFEDEDEGDYEDEDDSTVNDTPHRTNSPPNSQSGGNFGKLFSIIAFIVVSLSMFGFQRTSHGSTQNVARCERAIACIANSNEPIVAQRVEIAEKPWKSEEKRKLYERCPSGHRTKCEVHVASS
jgi:hypothetical protein